jgi:hypothetical protein
MFKLIELLRPTLVGAGKGGAQPNISQTVLKHLIVEVPPLKEQERIVTLLDSLLHYCEDVRFRLSACHEARELAELACARSPLASIDQARVAQDHRLLTADAGGREL